MNLSGNLLSGRFRADGKAHISMGTEAKKALSSFKKDIADGKILLSRHSQCPLCKWSSGKLIGEKDRVGVPCRTVVCDKCGLVFNDSFLDEASSTAFYKKYWRRIQWGNDTLKNFDLRTRPDSYSWKRFAFVALSLGDALKEINAVLEPGCGDGCNLLPYYLLGKEVAGSDYDEPSLKAGRRSGMRLVNGGVRELTKTGMKADLVILSHVVEHFIDVDAELDQVKGILKKGGYVYVEVPGIRYLNRPRSQALAGNGFSSTNDFLGYLQFQHNYHFELNTLRDFFERNSFRFIIGDEWIRAIFRYMDGLRASDRTKGHRPGSDIMDHLQGVERDYRCIKNKVMMGAKAALVQLKIHTPPSVYP